MELATVIQIQSIAAWQWSASMRSIGIGDHIDRMCSHAFHLSSVI
jgi:hypothetical protein